MTDHLVKAVADGVRIYAAVTTDLVNEAIRRHGCYPVAAAALGRTMTGALLLAANLKNKEALTVSFDGRGPLGRVVADATPEGSVRGMVGNAKVLLPLNAKGKIDVGGGVGTHGLVTVTRFTGLEAEGASHVEPIRGSAELVDGEIADDLTRYLAVSEQTPSAVGLGVLVAPDRAAHDAQTNSGTAAAADGTQPDSSAAAADEFIEPCIGAGGFLVQPLPDASEETLAKLEANVAAVASVSHLVERGLDAKGIIGEVLKGFDVDYLSTTDLAFRCGCSKARISDVLLGLNLDDLKSLVDDGHAEIVCHFCNEKYQFDAEELQAIYNVAKRQRAKK